MRIKVEEQKDDGWGERAREGKKKQMTNAIHNSR